MLPAQAMADLKALTRLLLVGGERNLETSRDSVIRTRFEPD
jgi:hypothetical protein